MAHLQELIMWDEDPDVFEELDEHDLGHESSDDVGDFGFDSEMGEFSEAEALDEYNSYFDFDNYAHVFGPIASASLAACLHNCGLRRRVANPPKSPSI
jgi:hypothetical protein